MYKNDLILPKKKEIPMGKARNYFKNDNNKFLEQVLGEIKEEKEVKNSKKFIDQD